MRFSAELYRVAAEERANQAEQLHSSGLYTLAHYVSGLAVECLLRAYRFRVDPDPRTFDEKHDLRKLSKASRFDSLIPSKGGEERKREIESAFGYIVNNWTNSHRFFSDDLLRSHLRRKRIYYKGDVLKEHSRQMTSNAAIIIALGTRRWSVWKSS